jgi:hypothetical protein
VRAVLEGREDGPYETVADLMESWEKRAKRSSVGYRATRLAWCGMKRRILNPACPTFRDYGGRGLTIEPEWIESFEAFVRDVGLRPERSLSLERVDNDLGYVRGNVVWATRSEQLRNRRSPERVRQDRQRLQSAA